MRHAGLLVEFDDGGLRIGTELGGGGAKGIRRLQGMPALHAMSALFAAADVNVELAVNGPTRNFDLVLLVDMRLFDVAAAVGTLLRQRRLVDFVDPLRRLAVGLGAVVLARFPARLLRLWLGRSLGERSSLSFAGPALLVEKVRQMFDLGAELGNLAFETDTVKAWCFGHTFTLAASVFFSCASLPKKNA